ncbi:hypothetical protein EUTSA_v10013115mg [Eutrema salsugineum]|uniref:WRKY domain-containing protein n=1 Tax=Eutrema salsugineum TaxID=72664 RepID=V4NAL9_EUTSA|nr:probable WRKY transcription factor 20 [Eutrema salsugineum]ESQ42891.1 hypothetical protein EUTSA_v10013115mg [Eutrema salsugineum]
MDPDISNRKESRVDSSASGHPDSRRDSSDCGGGGGGGARYKLMSPAKLPITRSTCITVPPGLSPTSFLESPVLLSNIKAEPSPTTGSLFKPHAVHANSSSYTARTIHQNILDDQKSSEFEFRPPASNMFYAELDKHRGEAPLQFRSQCHSFKHSPSSATEAAASSSEITRQTVPHRTTPSGSERSDPDESIQAPQHESRGSAPSILADDGYNWRKYGQKHVKGSEFPRSYYKCTHPNCEVKKLFERSHDGLITEIVYKGTHDHPKPQPSRRNSGGLVMPVQEERLDKYSSLNGRDEKGSSLYNLSPPVDQNGNPDVSPVSANDDGGDVARNNDEVDDNDPFSKRRRLDGAMEITSLVKPIREPRVVVQTLSEVDILDDGYRWRKYGQKVVRGNPNPRSYYKCTATGCPVRKHVERASHDPKAVITTYEGKHNHDVPTARSNNNNNNNHDMTAPRFRTEESTDTISLDLGVGIASGGPDHTSNEHSSHQQQQQQQHHIRSEFVQQTQTNGSGGFRFVHGPPMGPYYANSLNAGMNHQYNGSRETANEAQTGDISSSYPYPHNIGRIQSGP